MFKKNMLKIIIKPQNNKKSRLLDLFTFGIIFFLCYLIVMPVYPIFANQFTGNQAVVKQDNQIEKQIEKKDKVNNYQPHFPKHLDLNSNSANQNEVNKQTINQVKETKAKVDNKRELIIEKIGVKAPIIETDNEKEGLEKGAWLYPNSARPNKIGNTVISAHRYKYLPPHNITFYSLDKLILGDEIVVKWDGQENIYLVKEIKVVEDNDKSVIVESDESIITLITCHPLFTTEKRLVVIGERIK